MAQKIKIINNSSRELPEELALVIFNPDETLTKINNTADEYNLKVKEYERILEDDKIVEETIVIGDGFSN